MFSPQGENCTAGVLDFLQVAARLPFVGCHRARKDLIGWSFEASPVLISRGELDFDVDVVEVGVFEVAGVVAGEAGRKGAHGDFTTLGDLFAFCLESDETIAEFDDGLLMAGRNVADAEVGAAELAHATGVNPLRIF